MKIKLIDWFSSIKWSKLLNSSRYSKVCSCSSFRRRAACADCQAHRNSIIYLVTIWRRSEKWERKKKLWELINLSRLFSLTNFLDSDHLTRRLTRNRDTIFLLILIRQDSFGASCLSGGTTLISRFRINIVSFDAKGRSLLSNAEFHLLFHFIQDVFNQVFCLLYALLCSAEWVSEMRH